MVAEYKKEIEIRASHAEFAALVSGSLKRISFENKQKLLRIVLDKVVSTTGQWTCTTTSRSRSPLHLLKKKCQPNSICVPRVS
jgi:hypothetical protein